jgi:hypothetical protein
MPRNKDGKPIDPTDMNRADGFSPGSAMLVKVPGLDTPAAVRRSKLPPLTNLSRGLAKGSPVVVINARTGNRHPIWAEIDSNPKRRADRVLIIRPARNLEEGERYIVALRNLRNAGGRKIEPGRGFRTYRDRIRTGARPIEKRRRHFERMFRVLKRAGVKRRQLYLAWDFTVASERSLAGRMLHIRDDAFAQLGDRNLRDLQVSGDSPSIFIDSVTDLTPAEDDRIARKVEGRSTVPCYLTKACAPGGSFRFDKRGLPRRTGVVSAKFVCNIPRSALDPASPPKARVSLYGHGLLGEATEIDASNLKSMSNEHNFVFCATPWAGFSSEDVPHIVSVLGDFSGFNTVADRMQQGFLNMLYLGRAMVHPDGLSLQAAFQKNGQSILDTTRLFYDGNSQGGIMGRRPHRGRARLRPRGARGARHELLDAAAAQRRLRHLRGDPLPELPEGDRPAALAGPDPAALGPRRGERLRTAHDERSAAQHAAAQRAHARRIRGPPGVRHDGRGRGADDRRAGVPAGRTRRPLAMAALPDDPVDRQLPVRRLGDRDVGHRSDPDGRDGDPGHEPAAGDEHAEPQRRRPAREPALHSKRPPAEVRVPEGRGRRGGRMRREAVLRRAVHRSVGSPARTGPLC